MPSYNNNFFARIRSAGITFAMLSCVAAIAVRRGPLAVTAFSIAGTVGSRPSLMKAAAAASRSTPVTSTAFARRQNKWFGAASVGGGSSSSITALRQSTVAVKDLEQSMEVTHPAYEVIEKDHVCEYGAYCTLYRHKKSGAELLSVSSDDDNKVFGITFRTPPSDSTGVPHILEHSVLCGSRKYKTKDPFVQLLQGSLQTFLNAMTFPDRTCYVVASQNLKDFYNLINVYTDAVFHPRALSDPMVHAQEGWHLELEDKTDPLVYKGVVYNEMKGVYSSPDSLLNRASYRSIFPDNTYRVDSGGDPKVIPDLSYDQFVDFHQKYYHPANARIYFSGDDDVYNRLQIMDEYLQEFEETPVSRETSRIEWQSKVFDTPQREIHQYPAGADQPETHMLNVNWLLNDKPLTPLQEITLGILDHLLLGTTSSTLRKALMESGYGEAITGGGLSDDLLQAMFSIGMKGVQPSDVSKVEQLIDDTLAQVAKEGFTEEDIASSMNTIEFQLREFNTGSFPKGLSFMLGSMTKWIYEESPTDALKFEQPLAELKEQIATSGTKVFQDAITEFLINNQHRCTVELEPSKTLEEELLKDEESRLADIKSKLSDDDLDDIIAKTTALKELQAKEDSPDDRATIPSLELSDLTLKETEYPIEVTENENDSGITVVKHELGSTSGIAYVNVGLDLSVLPLDDVPLIPLFTKMLMEMGAGEYDDVALSQQIGTHTGGIDVSVLKSAVHPKTDTVDEASKTLTGENIVAKLIFQGKATSDKTDKLFSLMELIMTQANLDSQSKVIEMLKEMKSRTESRIQAAGHSMVNTRMLARYRPIGYIEEMMTGISSLTTIKQLLEQAEKDWPSLLARLEGMRTALLAKDTCRSGMFVDVTGDATVLKAVQPSLDSFLENLPGDSDSKATFDIYSDVHPWIPEAKKRMAEGAPMIDEGFVVPTQVSYVGKAGLVYGPDETVSGSAQVVSRFLRTGYLWDYVRVMGGAYGGFCTFSPYSGFFSFLSYRDPNLAKTIDVYDNAAAMLEKAAEALEDDPEALATAIIGTIGDRDGALSPDQKGYSALQRWLINESPEQRQRYRDEIIATKPADFKAFAERLRAMKDPSVAVVSSKAAFEDAAKEGKDLSLTDVL